ncbi:MAG: hypothetical protein RL685_2480 [Pseudomonadota bacterium]|jgi:hypothetical protein
MLQKLLALLLGATILGYFFFRPQLRKLGQRLDRVVTVVAWLVAIIWVCQLGYLWVTRR